MWRLLTVSVLCLLGVLALAQRSVVILPIPADDYRILDQARMLDSHAVADINRISKKAQKDIHAPIVVVTLQSLSTVGAYSADAYARQLFNAWAIGDSRYNRGVLLLVSRDDHKVRIELGQDWGYEINGQCQSIIDDWMIPSFKLENYSKGIMDGVKALDRLVREGRVPSPPLPVWVWPVCIVAGLIILLFIIDLVRNHMDGWAGSSLSYIGNSFTTRSYRRGYWDYDNTDNSSTGFFGGWGGGSSSDGGGGFSGGGSSGGGGASGSW